ncbi:MAG: class I SAM-dependent methyltransferase [Spirochaetia bacterium]
MKKEWYDTDTFWLEFAPYMFNSQRWSLARWETDKIIELLELSPGDSLLDSCCGVGRHAIPFAEKGLLVTGVDLTLPYLEAAKGTAENTGLRIEFINEDIRRFVRKHSFNAAINMFTSFGYFSDPQEEQLYLENIYQSLKPGGCFIIDTMGKEILAKVFTQNEWYKDDDAYVLAEYTILENWTKLENHWIIVKEDSKYEVRFSHFLYSAQEITGMLKAAGFSAVEIYGSLDRIPYDDKAKRLIAIGRKDK